jgi:hypothetical protein
VAPLDIWAFRQLLIWQWPDLPEHQESACRSAVALS